MPWNRPRRQFRPPTMVVGPREVAPVLAAVAAPTVEGGAAAVGAVGVVGHPSDSVVLQA